MKFLLFILLAFAESALSQTLYHDSGELHIKIEYSHPWLAELTVDNGGDDVLVFPASSNPPPYLAGYSISGGDFTVQANSTATAIVYPWGGPGNMRIEFNGCTYQMSPVRTIPEPAHLSLIGLLPILFKRRK